jgi:hydrogenase nickel incorporation protein HypA/HybF
MAGPPGSGRGRPSLLYDHGVHEYAIAQAIADQVHRHAAAPGRVREVEIRVGALRGLEPESLRLCWEAVTFDTPLAASVLRVDLRPWSLTCPACESTWTSPVPFVTCACGEVAPAAQGGDELELVALVVDDDADADVEGRET